MIALARWAIVLIVAWMLLPLPQAWAGRRYALLVGSNAGAAGEGRLRYAEADAERMARILRDVGGFEPDDVLLLTQVDAETTRRALINLNARIRAERSGSLLFVYFSGHGDSESLHLNGTDLDMHELRSLVSGSPAQARVLVVDSCRSGAITRIKGGKPASAFDVTFERPSAEGVAILTSSAAGEDSQESDALGASIFTHYYASALLGAGDRDGDGKVTLGESFSYASERTLAASAATRVGPQHPTYRYDLGGRDDVVLTSPLQAGKRVGILAFPEPGMWLVSQGKGSGAVVAEVAADDAGAKLALRPGVYVITKRARDHLLQGEVEVRESQSGAVDASSLKRIDYAQVVRKGGTERGAALSAHAVGGVRGSILDLGAGAFGGIGVRLDLPALSLEGRIGAIQSQSHRSRLRIDSGELFVAGAVSRALDLGPVTAGLAVELGALRMDQEFHEGQTPDRRSYGLTLGPVAFGEVPVAGPLSLRLEAALLTYFLPGERGNETPVAPRIAAGLGAFF